MECCERTHKRCPLVHSLALEFIQWISSKFSARLKACNWKKKKTHSRRHKNESRMNIRNKIDWISVYASQFVLVAFIHFNNINWHSARSKRKKKIFSHNKKFHCFVGNAKYVPQTLSHTRLDCAFKMRDAKLWNQRCVSLLWMCVCVCVWALLPFHLFLVIQCARDDYCRQKKIPIFSHNLIWIHI